MAAADVTASDTALTMAKVAAEAAREKLTTSLTALDVSERTVFTDVFLIASGETDRQVRAIVDEVTEALEKAGHDRRRVEGLDGEAHWVLADFGDLVVHVMQDEDLEYYSLDRLWGDCPAIDLGEAESA